MARSFGYRMAQVASLCLAFVLVGALAVICVNILGHIVGLARFAVFTSSN